MAQGEQRLSGATMPGTAEEYQSSSVAEVDTRRGKAGDRVPEEDERARSM